MISCEDKQRSEESHKDLGRPRIRQVAGSARFPQRRSISVEHSISLAGNTKPAQCPAPNATRPVAIVYHAAASFLKHTSVPSSAVSRMTSGASSAGFDVQDGEGNE